MTRDEADTKLRELARETAAAAKGYIEKALQPIVAGYIAGELSLGEARERVMDLAELSSPRIDLMLSTQKRRAQSIGQLASQDRVQRELYPAWRLVRNAWRGKPRTDWPERWAAAGASCGFEGALQNDFIALKDSPIWAALGRGEGGFRDTLGDPFPPFAFGSGMGWRRVGREECERLGLI